MRQLIQLEIDPATARQSVESRELIQQCEANSSSWVNLIGFVMEAISDNKVKVKLISDTANEVRKLGGIEAGEKAAIKVQEISTVELVNSFMQILTNSSAD